MGGPATFSGTTYQARVMAFICCHMLADAPLGWLDGPDVPTAVVPEVSGPGDDLWVECAVPARRFEAQAKHGLSGRSEIIEMLRSLSESTSDAPLVLVVDPTASAPIRRDLREDLVRLRSGRTAPLKEITRSLREAVPEAEPVLHRLRVVQVDLDSLSAAHTALALVLLRSALEDPDRAEAALAILFEHASDATWRRLQSTRPQIVALLANTGIAVKPQRPNDRWHARLDWIQRLLEGFYNEAALDQLNHLATDIAAAQPEAMVRYRLATQRAKGSRQLQRWEEAVRFAREALDFVPGGLEALLNACYASLGQGEISAAASFAARAQTTASGDVRTWIAAAWVSHDLGSATPDPPKSIAEDPKYILTLAQIALRKNSLPEAYAMAGRCMEAGLRTPEALVTRAETLLAMPQAARERVGGSLEDIERWTSSALEQLENHNHPTAHLALAVRAEARRALGNSEGAAADSQRLQELDPDDPNALRSLSSGLLEKGNTSEAYSLLLRPAVEMHADLLALRGTIADRLGQQAAALTDLDKAERRLGDARDPVRVRWELADLAITLCDAARAERLLTAITGSAAEETQWRIIRARLAWLQANRREATTLYQAAADADPDNRVEVLGELAHRLVQAGHFEEALQTFDLIEEDLPEKWLPVFAHALIGSNELVRAQQLIEKVGAKGSLPDWAVSLAVDLAGRSEDTEKQVLLLQELVERGGSRDEVRLRLALVAHLLELGQTGDAETQLESLIGGSLAPLEQAQAAVFLKELGHYDRAVDLAFAAYRAHPNDAGVVKAFITVTMLGRARPREVTEVGADTYVELQRQDGQIEAHTLYSAPPADRRLNEHLMPEAASLEIMGKKIGDKIVRKPAGWTEEWTVKKIEPAIVHAARDAAENYGSRFPGEPFFITSIPIGPEGSVEEWAPMIATLNNRRNAIERVFEAYGREGWPLSVVAKLIGASIPTAMIRGDVQPYDSPLQVEWGDPDGQATVLRDLAETRFLVIARSALHTAARLGLLGTISGTYRLRAPLALRAELDWEVREATARLADGWHMVSSGPSGIVVQDLAPGHSILREAVEDLREQREWLLSNVELDPRPLEVVAREARSKTKMRELLGASSYDSAALAAHSGGMLWADDLGLRRTEIGIGRPLKSCSTVTLLTVLAERGALAPDERDHYLLKLVLLRYARVIPTPELLFFALRAVAEFGQAGSREAISLLGTSVIHLGTAAELLCETLKRHAMVGIQTMSTHEVTLQALHAMAVGWPKQLVVGAVSRIAQEKLGLLPGPLRDCLIACREFGERLGGGSGLVGL
jgi:tetratricopeptide (TPR) repeat protein